VALKLLSDTFSADQRMTELFLREVKVMSRLRHANILTLLDYGEAASGQPFMVSELLTGYSLIDYLYEVRKEPLSPQEALELLIPISEAVHEAHTLGVIHRDIKPDNVFLHQTQGMRRPQAKLLDFGISKIKEGMHLTQHGALKTQGVLGTPYYMSPEQHMDTGSVDHRTDIYALGILLYQLLTLEVPFTGDTYFEIAKQHIQAPIESIEVSGSAAVREGLNALIRDCTAKDRARRVQSAEALLERLEALKASLGREAQGLIAFTSSPTILRAPEPAPAPAPAPAPELTQAPVAAPPREVIAPTLVLPERRPMQISASELLPPPPSSWSGGMALFVIVVVALTALGVFLIWS
jgi:eukaryotic-like serine/threonine-protein kinase